VVLKEIVSKYLVQLFVCHFSFYNLSSCLRSSYITLYAVYRLSSFANATLVDLAHAKRVIQKSSI